jgi:hypothetical protein
LVQILQWPIISKRFHQSQLTFIGWLRVHCSQVVHLNSLERRFLRNTTLTMMNCSLILGSSLYLRTKIFSQTRSTLLGKIKTLKYLYKG